MLGSNGKHTRESLESALKKKREGYGGKDLWKRKVLSLKWTSEGVVDGESGELIEEEDKMAIFALYSHRFSQFRCFILSRKKENVGLVPITV